MFRYNLLSCFPRCTFVFRSFSCSFYKASSGSFLPDHFTSPLLFSNNLDIDECSNGMHDCNGSATCMNTAGHFNCTCNSGYSGDGHLCSAIICCLVFQDVRLCLGHFPVPFIKPVVQFHSCLIISGLLYYSRII